MIAALILSFCGASQASCLEAAFLDLGRRSAEEAFLYHCFTSEDQKYKDLWNDYAAALEVCPLARERFLNDTASPMDALTRIGEECRRDLSSNRRRRDSLQSALARNARRKIRKEQAQDVDRKEEAQRYLRAHRSEVRESIEECLHLYETGLVSLRIVHLEAVDRGTFRVEYEGKDGSGAVVSAKQMVTLESDRCVFEEDAPEE